MALLPIDSVVGFGGYVAESGDVMNRKEWIVRTAEIAVRIAGVALIVLGFTIWALADEPAGAVAPPPAAPTAPLVRPRVYFGPSDRPDPRPIPQPAPADVQLLAAQSVAPAPEAPTPPPLAPAAPAAANAPAIHVVIPHDEHLHFTRVVHWHFPPRPARAVKTTPAPAPPMVGALPSPQAPSKFGGFFHR